jgi:signal transduction histidine kinase
MKTTTKISLVVLSLLILIGLSFLYLQKTERSQEKIVLDTTTDQYKEAFSILIENISKRYQQPVLDYSYWDEMCSFLKEKNDKWAKENLETVIETYGVDMFWLYKKDHNLYYSYPGPKGLNENILSQSKSLLDELYNKRVMKSFFFCNGVLVEVFGATVHPSYDNERKTDPQGFLFACKIWDNIFIDNLEKITTSKISVIDKNDISMMQNDRIIFNMEMPDYKGDIISFLKIEKSAPYFGINNQFSKKVLQLFLITGILIFLIVVISFMTMIGGPLKAIDQILLGDKSKVANLRKYGGEYSHLADLFEKSNEYNEELRKAKEKAEESDLLKSAFLTNISHEIRTPMNAIMGFTQLLPESFDNKANLEMFSSIIIERCTDLLDVINGILKISMLDSGQIKVKIKQIDLDELFKELEVYSLSVRNKLKKENIEFSMIADYGNQSNIVVADKEKIIDIFENLIFNAFKFSYEGMIEIGSFENEENKLVFYVKDSGIGIPKDMQSLVFERFAQLNNGISSNIGGTGLGLTISKGLVELLNGKIWVESNTGKGSIFYFTIGL